jgi:hypothetical protein
LEDDSLEVVQAFENAYDGPNSIWECQQSEELEDLVVHFNEGLALTHNLRRSQEEKPFIAILPSFQIVVSERTSSMLRSW